MGHAPGTSPWDDPATVRGFADAPPNATLLAFAADTLGRIGDGRAIDIGCGAARNLLPLARAGWQVMGTDLSTPMLAAAADRLTDAGVRDRVQLHRAPMDRLPAGNAAFDLIVAHGVWNLARSDSEFLEAVTEAARVARPGAGLFVVTFSRRTLPEHARPEPGQTIVFTQFSGEPQCFVTWPDLVERLAGAGFVSDPRWPGREINAPAGRLHAHAPILLEGGFRFMPAAARG